MFLGAVIDPDMMGWAILCLAAVLIGTSKTGFPGAGILAIPLFALAIGTMKSIGVVLPMLIAGDVLAVAYWRRHADWKQLLRLLPFAMMGIVVGWLCLGMMKQYNVTQWLGPAMGGIILVILGLSLWRQRRGGEDLDVPKGLWFPIVMGLVAGFTTMLCNAAGPIMIIYLLAMQLPKNLFVGTGAWYFLIGNCFKVPFSATLDLINPETLLFNAKLVPLIVVGGILGIMLVKVIPEKKFNVAIQVLAALGAVALIVIRPE